jgi:hypothetical protein
MRYLADGGPATAPHKLRRALPTTARAERAGAKTQSVAALELDFLRSVSERFAAGINELGIDPAEPSTGSDGRAPGTRASLARDDIEIPDFGFATEFAPGLVEAAVLSATLLDQVLVEDHDGYSPVDAAAATEIGLTPTQLEAVNIGIAQVNSLSRTDLLMTLPIHMSRPEVLLYVGGAAALAQRATAAVGVVAFIGLLLRLLLLLLKLLKALWKLLFRAKQNIKNIKDAKALKAAGQITAGQAAKIVALNLAELALQVAAAKEALEKLREKIQELRNAGQNEEANKLQEKVDQLQQDVNDLEKQLDELKQQEAGGK